MFSSWKSLSWDREKVAKTKKERPEGESPHGFSGLDSSLFPRTSPFLTLSGRRYPDVTKIPSLFLVLPKLASSLASSFIVTEYECSNFWGCENLLSIYIHMCSQTHTHSYKHKTISFCTNSHRNSEEGKEKITITEISISRTHMLCYYIAPMLSQKWEKIVQLGSTLLFSPCT